jgi:site-specific DNA-cytosine methylase
MLNLTVEDMASQPMVLKLKPVQTKKIVAAPSPVTFEPVSKRASTKYDDNKIAERIPIEELKSGKYELPIWAEGLFDATPEGMPRRRRRLGHLSNEQKMLRRKLKNRVAAQNARDKKKTESENLKLENEKLMRLVNKLQAENLQRENDLKSMAEENQDLRQRLGLDERTYRTSSEADSGCEELDRSVSSPGVFCVVSASSSLPGSPQVLKIEPVNSGSPPAERAPPK